MHAPAHGTRAAAGLGITKVPVLAADLEVNKEDLLAALTIMAGAVIAGAALAWLLGEE